MAWRSRIDLQRRVAGAKASLADEFLTRSQLVPGDNITFEYLPNLDIRINGLAGGGGGGASIRFLRSVIPFGYLPREGKSKIYNDNPANVIKRVYNDVHHNWGLSDRRNILWNIYEEVEGLSTPSNIADMIRLVAINQNTVRVWFPREAPTGAFYSDGATMLNQPSQATYLASMGGSTVEGAHTIINTRKGSTTTTRQYYIVMAEAK